MYLNVHEKEIRQIYYRSKKGQSSLDGLKPKIF